MERGLLKGFEQRPISLEEVLAAPESIEMIGTYIGLCSPPPRPRPRAPLQIRSKAKIRPRARLCIISTSLCARELLC